MSKEAALAQLDDSRSQNNVKGIDISGLDLTQCDISEVLYQVTVRTLLPNMWNVDKQRWNKVKGK